ncbi:MAG: carbamate kinase [Acholeplasmataceae bacterium]|nr:carbamate kinase [Acholeplasmataceae bacterium]
MSRYVISLGGNALGKDADGQKALLKGVAKALFPLIKEGHDIVIVHGNGPQVGMINLAFTESQSTPLMPFPECGAMSQGYIGFHIQNAIDNHMAQSSLKRPVVTLVSQVIVDRHDPAFDHPTKPIGSFYTKDEAEILTKTMGYVMTEDAGRGYRRVIASPKPIDIVEKDSILTLLDQGHVVIAAGGGGIPVVFEDEAYHGIDAVIDKDHASAKMAEIIGADALVILTAVDYVKIHFNTEQETDLKRITVSQLEDLMAENHFKKGSMLPKVEAAMAFVKATGHPAVIASLAHAEDAFKQQSGTLIVSG